MPRKNRVELARGQNLLQALKLSIDQTEARKRTAFEIEAKARAAAAKPAAAPKRGPRRVVPMIRPILPPPPPQREDDDRGYGLEIYCEQLLEILQAAPHHLTATGREVVIPLPLAKQIARDLKYLLLLRQPKKAA